MKLQIAFAFLILILSLRFYFFYQNQPRYTDGQHIEFKTTLLSEPQVFVRQQQITATLASGEKIFIKIPRFPEFHYGDTVHISGNIRLLVLKNKKVIATMFFPKTELLKRGYFSPFNSLLAVTGLVRQKIISVFSSSLPPTLSSLLLGIVFGIKENMPKDFTEYLRTSGVMHVVVASGMNVTLIAGFLSSVFSLFLRRQIALLAAILGIVFYAFLAGLEPSILRASIMGILLFSGQVLGRQNLPLFGLFIAAFLMLFFSPQTLFDVGFQLSFAATLGLLYLKPLPTTLAAQIATIPILLSNFGTYSLWSLFANFLVLWSVPILMVIGGLGGIFGMIFEPLGHFTLYLSLPLLFYFEKVITFFGQGKGVLAVGNIPWQFIVSYYLFLVAFIATRK